MDITAMDMVAELQAELAQRHITFALARVKQDLYAQLKKSQLLAKMGPESVFYTLHTAIASFENRSPRLPDGAIGLPYGEET